MSETTVVDAPATEVEKPKEQTFKDALQKAQFEELNKMILSRNDLVGRANAASGDRLTLTEQIRENSTDPDIAEAREQMSQWSLKLDELVKPIVDKMVEDSKGSIDDLESKIKEADGTLKPGLTFYRKMYGDDAAGFFADLARLKGIQVRSGGGGRRIRGYTIFVTLGDSDKTVGYENFSSAAKAIGVDTLDVQQAFMAKAGTEDAAKFPPVVEFLIDYPHTDKDGNKSTLQAQVRAEKNEEEPASDEATASDSSDEAEVASDEVISEDDISDVI